MFPPPNDLLSGGSDRDDSPLLAVLSGVELAFGCCGGVPVLLASLIGTGVALEVLVGLGVLVAVAVSVGVADGDAKGVDVGRRVGGVVGVAVTVLIIKGVGVLETPPDNVALGVPSVADGVGSSATTAETSVLRRVWRFCWHDGRWRLCHRGCC